MGPNSKSGYIQTCIIVRVGDPFYTDNYPLIYLCTCCLIVKVSTISQIASEIDYDVDILCFCSSGSDFSNGTINITIPANRMSFEIPKFFTIDDDDINELQQSFAIIAEIVDVPENISCFQRAIGEIICQGRRGATAIRIIDNDREL